MRRQFSGKLRPEIVLIGASTGGPQALTEFLSRLPQISAPVVVVQHTNSGFLEPFAKLMAKKSGLILGEMTEGEELCPGSIYVPRGEYHIKIERSRKENGKICLRNSSEGLVNGHRPAIDVLFKSADQSDIRCLSVLMTGMGSGCRQGRKY